MLSTLIGRFLGIVAPCALAWGCGSDTGGNQLFGAGASGAAGSSGVVAGSSAGGSTVGNSAGSNATGGTGSGSGEFPCDVQALLATKCQACHKIEPPGALLAAADFSRPSKIDPQKTVGQVALERVQLSSNLRMPPAPLEAATAAEIAALSSWIQGGAQPTTCGQTPVPTAPDPYDTPVVCTSMKNWTGGNRESPLMRPGGACVACHTMKGEGPIFAVSGTVFPTPHEPDDCNGVTSAAGAQVVVTEANGTAHTLKVNDAGNFYLEVPNFAYPYQAKVIYQGRERVMVEAQMSGDCNACHTLAGTEKAPGRIFLP
jgi:mono/diheme cytochrome c family protein